MRYRTCGGKLDHHAWSPLWDLVKGIEVLQTASARPQPPVVERILGWNDEGTEIIPVEVEDDEVVRELPELVPEVEDKVVAPVIELMEIQYD